MESLYALEDHFLTNEPDTVESVFALQGFSFAGAGQNAGMAFINLKDWGERSGAELSADAVAARAMAELSQVKDAVIHVMVPPAMPELGIAAGFSDRKSTRLNSSHVAI